ncbi:hypothetical protein TWF696_008823 [Orbilia brochopaga]|uniref:Uncharacterized protein n=1 Tax=Orbilia brochopaga TaxID=3140254 RepID=A0AAV9UFS2_9PEZI
MSCFKKNDVVYVNWAPEAPTWDEVVFDLVLRTILWLCCWVATLITVVATPRSELSTLESFVKGVAVFLLAWSLACYCSDDTRRETALVVSQITRPVLSPVLASSRAHLHRLSRVLVTVMMAPVVMFVKGVAAMKGLLPLPESVSIRRRQPRQSTTEKPTARTSEQVKPRLRPHDVHGNTWRRSLPGSALGTIVVSSPRASQPERRRRPVPDSYLSSRPTSLVPPRPLPSPFLPPPPPAQLASPPPPLPLQPPPQALLVGPGAAGAAPSSSDAGLAYARRGPRYKDRSRSKYHQAPRYDLIPLV